MAKTREEIVGKRFLCVSGSSKLKLSKINEWDWRAGVIRACSHNDSKHQDLQVLVEYDDVEWQRREWVHVYRGQVFQIFLLERTLAWASRKHPNKMRAAPVLWPALVYVALVDQAGISEHKYRPVEYLVDRTLDYHDYSQIKPYQDGDYGVCGEECISALRAWVGDQDGQRILLTTPSVLVGFRVQVYRAEGTTQWYTAVIVGYNDATRELTVTDDTVLEEHSEDPSLVQIRLIGEGVVESILRGENVGITPRRSRTATNNHHQSGVRHIRRDGVLPARARKNSLSRPNNLHPNASHTLPPAPAPTHAHTHATPVTAHTPPLPPPPPPPIATTTHPAVTTAHTTTHSTGGNDEAGFQPISRPQDDREKEKDFFHGEQQQQQQPGLLKEQQQIQEHRLQQVKVQLQPVQQQQLLQADDQLVEKHVKERQSGHIKEHQPQQEKEQQQEARQEKELTKEHYLKEVKEQVKDRPQQEAEQQKEQQLKQEKERTREQEIQEEKEQVKEQQVKQEREQQLRQEKEQLKEHHPKQEKEQIKEHQPKQEKEQVKEHHSKQEKEQIKEHHPKQEKEQIKEHQPKQEKEQVKEHHPKQEKEHIKEHQLKQEKEQIKDKQTQQEKEQTKKQQTKQEKEQIKEQQTKQEKEQIKEQQTKQEKEQQSKSDKEYRREQPVKQEKEQIKEQSLRHVRIQLQHFREQHFKQEREHVKEQNFQQGKKQQLRQIKEEQEQQIKKHHFRQIKEEQEQQIKKQQLRQIKEEQEQQIKKQQQRQIKEEQDQQIKKQQRQIAEEQEQQIKKQQLRQIKEEQEQQIKQQQRQINEEHEQQIKKQQQLRQIQEEQEQQTKKQQFRQIQEEQEQQIKKQEFQQKEEQQEVSERQLQQIQKHPQLQIKKHPSQRSQEPVKKEPSEHPPEEGKEPVPLKAEDHGTQQATEPAKEQEQVKERTPPRVQEQQQEQSKEESPVKTPEETKEQLPLEAEEEVAPRLPKDPSPDARHHLPRKLKVQLSRQLKVQLSRQLKDQLPQRVKDHLPEQIKEQLSKQAKEHLSRQAKENIAKDSKEPLVNCEAKVGEQSPRQGKEGSPPQRKQQPVQQRRQQGKQQTARKKTAPGERKKSPQEQQQQQQQQLDDDDSSSGKCVVRGLRWRKRGQGSVTSEASSGEEETRTVRERRPRHHTPDPPRRIFTRLEKQHSTEDTTSSSSGNSTPDHRPTRRTYRNNRVQNISNTGHSDTDIISISSSISSTNSSSFNTSTSGSNTSASSTSTSSSSTPEPELPSRPPSRRVAAAAALRRQKLRIHRSTGGKRAQAKNGVTRRPIQRWRSVSPATRTTQPLPPSKSLYSNKTKNNENNRNSTNCEDNISKSQKRKNNSPNRVSNKNNKCGTDIELPAKGEDLLEPKPQLSPNKDIRKEACVTDAVISSEDPIVVYEKTNFQNRTPPNRRQVENRNSNSRKASLNSVKDPTPNRTVHSQAVVKNDSTCRVIQSNKSYRKKEVTVNQTRLSPEGKYTCSDSSSSVTKESAGRSSTDVKLPRSSSTCNDEVFIIEPSKEESVNTSPVSATKAEESTWKPVLKSANKELGTKDSLVLSNSSKDENPIRTFSTGALVTPAETSNSEIKCKSETAVEVLVDSQKDISARGKLSETKEDSYAKGVLECLSPSESNNSTSDNTNVCTCACSNNSSSDSLVTSTAVVRKPSVSEDGVVIESTSVIQTAGDNSSAIVSQHDRSVKSAIFGLSANSVVVSSSTAAVCNITTSVSTVSTVTSVSIVPGTTSAIVSSSNVSGVAWSSESCKVNSNSNSNATCSSSSSRGCAEVAGVVSGRAVTITATSGPGPTCSSRVASPPSVSITAVVRSPVHLQPANPDPVHPAPHHHDGAPHSSLHHQHQAAHPHHHQQHHQLQQHQSQQLSTSSTTTRMDHCDGSSDSGVSVTERSVSRSSVLSDDRSSSAEVKPNTPTPAAGQTKTSQAASSLFLDRKEPVRVWRDPSLVSQSEHTVRHIHSVQHTSMSQHYPGVPPPHLTAPTGGSGGSHGPAHHGSHGQPPATIAHGMPPGLPYPTHHGASAAGVPPPLHLPLGLQQPLAGLYPSISHDIWKQHAPVAPLPPHYAGLITHHQEELLQLERARDRAEQDRLIRERREAEAREKERINKEKMERERTERERERREREERERREKERREREEKERQQFQVDQHFNKSFRLAQQKHGGESVRHMPADHLNQAYFVHGLTNHHPSNHPTHNHSLLMTQHSKAYQAQAHAQKVGGWNQLSGLVKPERVDAIDERRLLEQQQRQEEAIRRAQEPEKMVHESIYKFFRDTDRVREPQAKMRYPPPAHSSKPPVEKPTAPAGLPKLAEPSFNLGNYPPNYLPKDAKLQHASERAPYSQYPDPRDKASVIIQPEVKYEKAPPHSLSPKQRPPERSSPYPPGSAYKSHDPSSSLQHRSNTSHHPTSLPHSVELPKARQPQSSPHSAPSPAHPDRYYPPGARPPSTTYPSNLIAAGLVPNPIHVSSVSAKSKVSSPPPQMYGKPGITTGTPVCRVDSRPTQPVPLTSKAPVSGPPPAHSGRGSHSESRIPMPSHEQRPSIDRGLYDARIYPPTVPSPHHKHVVAPGPPPVRMPPASSPHVATPHIPPHPSPQPTQTQPLDLGTREDTASPTKRRTQTPTPQDPKKARFETTNNPPLLSRVSEPSPLYPTAATTITTVENTVALAANLSRVASPASRPPSQPPPATTPTLLRTENSSSPGANKIPEPEKSSSPGPVGGYVHKLKKAWLQRHENTAEILPPTSVSTGLSTRVATPPPASTTTAPSKPTATTTTTTTTTTVVKSEPKTVVRKPKVVNNIPNGHSQDIKDGDSSSTDSEGSTTQKPKRGKGKRKLKKLKRGSDSNSDSDKDSDASETAIKNPGRIPSKPDSEPKKRGRKPKTKQEKDKEEGPKPKKSKEEPPQNDPLQKPPVSQLKKTGESFLQDGSCYEVAPKLPKCRECRWTAHQRNKKMPNIFCRFYAFRRLRYTKNGQLAVAGFSDPIKDAYGEDLKLWVPDIDSPPSDLDVDTSKFLLTHVGDQFCDLVEQEKEAMALHMGDDTVVAWKRVVQGVREMCDVCETTLFNIHWACSKCGFVVCIDCYKGRKNGTVKVWDEGGKDRDEYSWLLCASRLPHEQDKLMLTQIISGNALLDLGRKVHEVRHQWNIPQYCDCVEAKKYKEQASQDDKKKVNGVNKDLLKNIKKEPKTELVNGTVKQEKTDKVNGKDEEMSNSPLNFFADVALSNDKRESESSDSDSDSDSDEKEGNFSTLRKLLIQPNGSTKEETGGSTKPSKESSKKKPKLDTVDEVISCVIENNSDKDDVKDNNQMVLKHFIRKYNYGPRGRDPLPIRIMTKTESNMLYPGVAHSWLCDGKLLRLLEPLAPGNTPLFQDQWKRGQPVLISGVGQKLNPELWTPQSFSKDFGDIKNDLVNCLTGNIVPNQPMKKFWDGFENYGKRLKDEKGQPMVLKLKDWPPGDDFAEMLPTRFEDLMTVLPMGEYTRRNGRLNLAGRLPECFVRPDLGPKMYIAYGSAIHANKASTNLHLDISDAVNVMCYVGVPKDADYEEHIKEALKAIDEAGCDILTRRRVREKEEVPGALWHIYHARDSDKIRDLLNKVAIERGDKLEPHHDPIHDQAWYLDGPLRERLYKEYGVEGYAIIQCLGDAVFIPAGAPHQVRNLHNCVKVAEDFVSPENVSYCFHLTQEFRHLSDTHTNHEDKLQIKNIIYHDMKDSMACLMATAKKDLQIKTEAEEDLDKKVKESDS